MKDESSGASRCYGRAGKSENDHFAISVRIRPIPAENMENFIKSRPPGLPLHGRAGEAASNPIKVNQTDLVEG